MEETYDNSRPVRSETKHNQHRRSFWHDYYQKGLYMVTMVIEGRQRLFGTIAGHANGRRGTNEAPHIMLSELGRRVFEKEVPKNSGRFSLITPSTMPKARFRFWKRAFGF